jgi:hypothetical protein
MAVLLCGIAAESARVDKFPDEVDRGTIVPVQILLPAADFLLEEGFECPGMYLAKVDNLHASRELPLRTL